MSLFIECGMYVMY